MRNTIGVVRWMPRLTGRKNPDDLSIDLRPFVEFSAGINLVLNSEEQKQKDNQRMHAIASGDFDAFSSLYDEHSSRLYALIRHILHDAAEAQDVLQETFVQVWKSSTSYNGSHNSLFSWLLAIARNKAIDKVRGLKRRNAMYEKAQVEHALSGVYHPPEPPSEGVATMLHLLCKLPPEQADAIKMAFFSGLSHDEISTTLNVPLGTIKARIRRGMSVLKDHMEAKR